MSDNYLSETLYYAWCVAPNAPHDAVRIRTLNGVNLVYCRFEKWQSADGKSGGFRYVPLKLSDVPDMKVSDVL